MSKREWAPERVNIVLKQLPTLILPYPFIRPKCLLLKCLLGGGVDLSNITLSGEKISCFSSKLHLSSKCVQGGGCVKDPHYGRLTELWDFCICIYKRFF